MGVVIDHIQAILVSANVGVVGAQTGWRIGQGRMTDQPDTQICLYDSPGEHPDPKWLLDYPYIQVIVRGSPDSYGVTRQKAQDVYDALIGLPPTAFGSDNIDAITVIGNPSHIGNDQKNRPLISGNYRIIFEPGTSTLTHRLPLGA